MKSESINKTIFCWRIWFQMSSWS